MQQTPKETLTLTISFESCKVLRIDIEAYKEALKNEFSEYEVSFAFTHPSKDSPNFLDGISDFGFSGDETQNSIRSRIAKALKKISSLTDKIQITLS